MKRALAAVAVVVVLGAGACPGEQITEHKLFVVRDGQKREVIETVRKNRGKGGELVQQRHIISSSPEEAVLVVASLDMGGFATGASFRREGSRGKRYVELTTRNGKRILFSRGDDETVVLPDHAPIVLVETEHRIGPELVATKDVILVDLENALAMRAKLDATGVHIAPLPAPPAPAPTDPVLGIHTAREPFIESETKAVVTWCKSQAAGAGAVDAAKAIALAAKPKIRAERAGGAASAFAAVQVGGGDDAGAALVVACLRALEHPARVVSGRVGERDTRVDLLGRTEVVPLRSWAQVHDGKSWVDVDATDIDVDGKMKERHVAFVEGFRGPLTTGLRDPSTPRVMQLLPPPPAPASTPPAPSPSTTP